MDSRFIRDCNNKNKKPSAGWKNKTFSAVARIVVVLK